MKIVLTIAGTDPTGTAGAQADLRTITKHGLMAMNVLTAVVAQNAATVRKIVSMPESLVQAQLDCVFEQCMPDAIKIGMIPHAETAYIVAQSLVRYGAKNIIIDPVTISSSGHPLVEPDAEQAIRKHLFPIANLVTPNIPEAGSLSGLQVKNKKDMCLAAKLIAKLYDVAVLLKGGHLANRADDLLFDKKKMMWFEGERISSHNTRGTGCRLSSAIACNLANGDSLAESVHKARSYLREMLELSIY